MVVFTCSHCGEALQKPKVEKHYNVVCRTNKVLTCVDCLKDFRGEEYVTHTKCLTEDERYAAKGSIPGGSLVKKGEQKQENWVEMIRNIIDKQKNLSLSIRKLLETISTYNNVPRKKPKFINFVKNSFGGRINIKDVEAVWDIIEKHKNENQKNQANNNNNGNENKRKSTNNETAEEPPKKKVKNDKELVTNGKEAKQEPDTDIFSFKTTILNILAQKGEITPKKLQKKVLSRYKNETGNEVTDATIKKYSKKLRKLENVSVTDSLVQLIESK